MSYQRHAVFTSEQLQYSFPLRLSDSRCSRTSTSPYAESAASEVKTTRNVKAAGTRCPLKCPFCLPSPPHLPLECLNAPFLLLALLASLSSARASTA